MAVTTDARGGQYSVQGIALPSNDSRPSESVRVNKMSGTPGDLPLEIDVRGVKKLLDDQVDFFLLDCREPGEYAIAKLESAVLIPMREIPARLPELEPVREHRIVVHCHHGGRSLQVTQWLQQQGFAKVQNMAGGIDAWSVEIDRSVARY